MRRAGLFFVLLFSCSSRQIVLDPAEAARRNSPDWTISSEPGGKKEEDPKDKAKRLYEEAEGYYNVREYEKALSLFKEAYLLTKEPELILNMGQCYRKLGRYEEAKDTFKTFLREDPETPYRKDVEKILSEIEGSK
jgi:tetratricopeptide (TPR) repeat protein